MKVVFLLNRLDSGGLENYLLRFLTYCFNRDLGLDVTIICKGEASGMKDVLAPKFIALDVAIEYIPISHLSLKNHLQLYKYLKEKQFNVLCDFGGYLSGFVMLLAFSLRIHIRIAAYRESRFQFKPTVLKRLYVAISKRLVNFFATKVLSNSVDAFRYFHPKYQKKLKYKVIQNSIDLPSKIDLNHREKFRISHGIPINSFVVGNVGRFTPSKNHAMVSKFISQINKLDDSVHFLLCGKGVQDGMTSLSAELQNVHCIDYLESLDVFYNALDLFYFPSLNEGHPNVLLEAMATGLPIIASDITAIKETSPEIVKPFLVPALNMEMTLSAFNNYRKNPSIFPSEKVSQIIIKKYASDVNFELFIEELKGSN